MFHQHLTDKDEADTLSVRLGGEERGKEFGFYLFADAFTSIADFEHKRRSPGADKDFSVGIDAFCGILDDVDKDLLKKRSVHADDWILFAQFQVKVNLPILA